jgi:hypothetical protein
MEKTLITLMQLYFLLEIIKSIAWIANKIVNVDNEKPKQKSKQKT